MAMPQREIVRQRERERKEERGNTQSQGRRHTHTHTGGGSKMQTIATLIQLTKWTVARQGHAGHARGRGRGRVWVGVDAASGSVPGPCDTTKKLWSPSTESSHESKSETMHGERAEKE